MIILSTVEMCILFVLIGTDSHPTLICNNRDEFIGRPTVRGRIDTHIHENDERSLRYTPKDMEKGGSWLSFDRLVDKHDRLRFAVVLNFDTFREDHLREMINHNTGSQRPLSELRSRGNLVKDFIDSDITAEEYAQRVFMERYEFRPFNLIISDGYHGAYYISSSVQQQVPIRLDSGVLYGISNGYMNDDWAKVSLGKELITNLLGEDQQKVNNIVASQQNRQPEEQSSTAPSNSPSTHWYVEVMGIKDILQHPHIPQGLPHYLNQLMNVLRVNDDLADPTYEMQNKALCQIASIYVKPTIILMDEVALTRNIPLIDHHITLEAFLNKEVEPVLEDHFYEETLLGKLVFATRTHTLFLHWSKSFLNKHTPVESSHHKSKSPLFFILECDYSFQWDGIKRLKIDHDINCFHNFHHSK